MKINVSTVIKNTQILKYYKIRVFNFVSKRIHPDNFEKHNNSKNQIGYFKCGWCQHSKFKLSVTEG